MTGVHNVHALISAPDVAGYSELLRPSSHIPRESISRENSNERVKSAVVACVRRAATARRATEEEAARMKLAAAFQSAAK